MNFRERILNIYRRMPVDNIVFAPRMEYLFNRNKELGRLPEPYCNMELLEFFDALNCAPRPYGEYGECLELIDPPGVHRQTWVSRTGEPFQRLDCSLGNLFEMRTQFTWSIFPPPYGKLVERIETPLGSLERHITYTDSSYHTTKYPVEAPEDIRIAKYLLQGRSYTFNLNHFQEVDDRIATRSAPMMALPRTNVQRLNIDLMGFENTVYALHDQPTLIEGLIQVIDASDESLLEVIVNSPIAIIGFDDNVDQHLVPPTLFKRYILPAYQRRANYLHERGKFCYSHWDGMCRLLLPYISATHVDGIEALTPVPMGVITVEEMKQAMGEQTILLDGIPMTCFLPDEPIEELEDLTHKIIEAFSPNLILGISDEPSPDCSIERIQLVSEIVQEYEGRVMELPGERKT